MFSGAMGMKGYRPRWPWHRPHKSEDLPASPATASDAPVTVGDLTTAIRTVFAPNKLRLFLEPFDIRGLGTGEQDMDSRYMRVTIISLLNQVIRVRRISGSLSIGAVVRGVPLNITVKDIAALGDTVLDVNVHFTDAQLRGIERLRDATPPVEMALSIEREEGGPFNVTLKPGVIKIP